MYCPNCGAQMAEGAGVCPQCGVDPRGFVAQHTAAPRPPAMPSGPVPPSPLAGIAPQRKGMPVIGIVALVGGILFFIFVVLGILAAIAIPDFLKFQAKAKQSEARQNLADIYTEQTTYYTDHGGYASDFDMIHWRPLKGRYAYFLPNMELQPEIGGPYALPEDVKPYVTKDGFLAVAVGNVDNDGTLDVWTINEKRELKNLVNDTMQ